jgi:uncharacterized membrane protein YcjF (UPF0283 family)
MTRRTMQERLRSLAANPRKATARKLTDELAEIVKGIEEYSTAVAEWQDADREDVAEARGWVADCATQLVLALDGGR